MTKELTVRPSLRFTPAVAVAAAGLLLAACGGGQQAATAPIEVDTETPWTMADVAQHSDPEDCWTTIDGNVYDLSDFVREHPGGANRIMEVCGQEASEDFSLQHSNSVRAQNELADRQIGVLE